MHVWVSAPCLRRECVYLFFRVRLCVRQHVRGLVVEARVHVCSARTLTHSRSHTVNTAAGVREVMDVHAAAAAHATGGD